MLTPIYETLHITSEVSVVIVSVALMLFSGFAMTRVTKRLRLPNVTAYIVAGILMGPYCLNLIPGRVVSGMSFVADIALAFIAFSNRRILQVLHPEKERRKGNDHHRHRRRALPRCWCSSWSILCWGWS